MKVTTMSSGIQMEGPTAAQQASQAAARDRAIKMLSTPAQVTPQPTSAEDMPKATAETQSTAQIHPSEEAKVTSSESVESSKAETKTTETEKPLSSEYAVLARKERAIRQREQQLKAREAAIRSQEEAARAPKAPTPAVFDESKYISKDKLAQSPFEALAELGLTYDQLTEMAMNAPKPEQVALQNELKALRDEIKSLKSDNEGTKKSFAEQQTQAYNQAVKQIRDETRSLVRNNPEFETIRGTNSVNDVVDLIEQTFKQDGILLTVEEAATEVENYLVEEAMKLTKLNKIRQRLQPKESSAPATKKSTEEPKQQQLKTLTNAVSSSRPLSAKERAVLAFEGKLKS